MLTDENFCAICTGGERAEGVGWHPRAFTPSEYVEYLTKQTFSQKILVTGLNLKMPS